MVYCGLVQRLHSAPAATFLSRVMDEQTRRCHNPGTTLYNASGSGFGEWFKTLFNILVTTETLQEVGMNFTPYEFTFGKKPCHGLAGPGQQRAV